MTVAVWQHDLLLQAVQARYLCDVTTARQVHSNLADYFLGTWAGRDKPMSDQTAKRWASVGVSCDRKVPAQPHTFGSSSSGQERFNKRKYDQVPRHLDLAGESRFVW